jgi:hypothetical protein
MSKLVCPECRHENEPERVYCHNCGARLNRTEAAVAAKNEEAQTIETRERLRRMMDGRAVKARLLALNIAKLLLGSCAAAALILMFLAPDLPQPAERELDLGPQIGLDLENALLQHRGAQLTYNEAQVNNYLANALKRKKTSLLDKPLLEFRRGIAQFGEGTFRMTLERSFLGWPLYTSGFYRASVQDGKIAAATEGGSIGRMPIHPQLMQYADFLVGDSWKALEQDRKQVEKLSAIEFHPQTVVLTTPTH